MIDPADKQTESLPLEQPKRGRGRPSTGAAMTPAEKQKAYRERKAKNSNAAEIEQLRTENEQLIKMLDEANKEKKYWIDRALKKGAESTKPRFELQYKSHSGRWVKGAYQEDMYDELMTKEAAEALRARMQKATDDDPKGTLTWRIKELK